MAACPLLADATAARPSSNTVWLRPKAALGVCGARAETKRFPCENDSFLAAPHNTRAPSCAKSAISWGYIGDSTATGRGALHRRLCLRCAHIAGPSGRPRSVVAALAPTTVLPSPKTQRTRSNREPLFGCGAGFFKVLLLQPGDYRRQHAGSAGWEAQAMWFTRGSCATMGNVLCTMGNRGCWKRLSIVAQRNGTRFATAFR